MILNKEDHRILLLKIIDTTNFPGTVLELILELKQAIKTAKIADKEPDKKPDENLKS